MAYRTLRQAGICIACGRHAAPRRVRCAACHQRALTQQRRRRAAAAAQSAAGEGEA